jgi:hypothetical protein
MESEYVGRKRDFVCCLDIERISPFSLVIPVVTLPIVLTLEQNGSPPFCTDLIGKTCRRAMAATATGFGSDGGYYLRKGPRFPQTCFPSDAASTTVTCASCQNDLN